MKLATQITLAILLLAVPQLAIAADEPTDAKQQWGDFSGTFILDGPIPAAKEIKQGNITVPEDSLVVDAKTGRVANVFVYLLPVPGEKLAVHPSYDAEATATIVLAVENHRFSPHAITLRTSQTINIANKDPVAHGPVLECLFNPQGGGLVLAGEKKDNRLTITEGFPILARDSIEPGLKGWCLLQDHPYMAISDAQGKFTIKNLPVGQAKFRVWHEKGGVIKSAVLSTGSVDWPMGKLTTTIKLGANDLGKIRVSPKLFEDRR